MADLEVLVEGNRRIVRAAFRVPADDTGVLTDPTTVVFTARKRKQAGDVAAAYAPTTYTFPTAEVARTPGVAVGSYDFTFLPGEGTWAVHVQGTGAAYAAGEVAFVVDRAEALA